MKLQNGITIENVLTFEQTLENKSNAYRLNILHKLNTGK